MEQPKQLNIECTLGALLLPELGSLNSVNAKYRSPDYNPTTNLSTNYENYANASFSKNFKTISKGPGGSIPRLNLTIGAPKATFAEGAIKPGGVHPVYNLLKGATTSNFNNAVYRLPTSSQEIPSNEYSGVSYGAGYQKDFEGFNLGSSGYIPLDSGEISEADKTPRETYNIWKQFTNNDLSKKYLIGLGVTNYEALGATHIESPSGPSIPGIVINAANSTCLIERYFPIADDLLYNSPSIYFTKIGGSVLRKTVQAKGGANCGFWLRFENLSEFSIYRSGNTSKKSSLRFAFGNFNKTYQNKISQFAVIISDNYSILNYLNPRTNQWTTVNLSNKANISSGYLDIFVHFAGPNMFIGFDKEISQWNVIDPIALDDTDDRFDPYIDHESTIQVFVENFNCIFHYSPICFDSFDQELVTPTLPGTTYSNTDGNASINITLDVSKVDALAVSSCDPVNLNTSFIEKRYNPLQSYDIEKRITDLPTFYSDWRRINSGTKSDTLTDDKYNLQPELKYYQISVTDVEDKPGDPRKRFKGVVRYETTIEGPIFFYVRNFKDNETTTTPKMVREIWGKFSDISKYFSSAQITEQFLFINKSFKKTTAKINLINLTNDQVGRQILNALQENVLAITLKCGYDNDDKKIFFQGIITKVTVARSSDAFTVELTCLDLGCYLLENIHFNLINPTPIGFRTFKLLFEDVFELAGLLRFYKPRARQAGFDVLYDEYFNRIQGLRNSQSSLMNPTLSATIDKNVFNILEAILPWFVYSNDSVSTYVDSLPIFRWDPDSETFILGLRKDEEPEKIWLVGKPSDEQLLANSNVINDKPSLHGVAIGDASWTEETDINNLHSEVVLVYRKWDGLIGVERSNPSFTSRAVSQASYEQLNNLIQESPNSEFSQLNLGYVGFNKILYKNFIENGNFKTSKLMRLQLFRDEYSSRFTIQNLTLNVYVTQPLKSHYKFTVDSFEDSGVIDYSGEYIFNTVTYEINADTNLIKAKIEGEYIPVPD